MLSGIVFDADNNVGHVDLLAKQLEKNGAVPYGTTVSGCTPSTPLPHPYHPAIELAGSTGAGSLSVALGLSTFSLGANGGGSNRITAGLLGLSGVYNGDAEATPKDGTTASMSPHVGSIARTPLDNALIYNAASPNPTPLTDFLKEFYRPLAEDTSIGFLSEFAPEKDWSRSVFQDSMRMT